MLRVAGTLALGAAMTAAARVRLAVAVRAGHRAACCWRRARPLWVAGRGAARRSSAASARRTVEEERDWPVEITARRPASCRRPAASWSSRSCAARSRWRAARAAGCASTSLRAPRRRRLEPARLVIRDPLGLLERRIEAGAGRRCSCCRGSSPSSRAGGGAGAAADGGGGRAARGAAAELELESLRPVPRGRARLAHPLADRRPHRHDDGAAAARRRGLAPARGARPAHPASEEALDKAVRAAASLSVHLARAGGCSLLLPGDRRAADIDPELGAWPPLHVAAGAGRARRRRAVRRGSRRAAARSSGSRRGRACRAALARAAGRALPGQPGRRARRRRVRGRRLRGRRARPRRGGGRRESALAHDWRSSWRRSPRSPGTRPRTGRRLRRRRARRARVRLRPDRRRGRRRARCSPTPLRGRARGVLRARLHGRRARRGLRGDRARPPAASRPRTGTSSATGSTAASRRSAPCSGPTTARSRGRRSCCSRSRSC